MNKKSFIKDSAFLSQIPEWENKYKLSQELAIDFEKEKWRTASANFTDHDLTIFGCAVMEDWETPYMKELAKIATTNGGVILELGFGMAISASFIQNANISKHIIIEANHDVAERARKFAKKSPRSIEILEGFWEEMINLIPNESVDGILFDTYPLTDKELYQNHFNFFPFAFNKLKRGGIFTYYSDEVIGFGAEHLKKLAEAGFDYRKITGKIVSINPPADCEYWKAKTILAPIITK